MLLEDRPKVTRSQWRIWGQKGVEGCVVPPWPRYRGVGGISWCCRQVGGGGRFGKWMSACWFWRAPKIMGARPHKMGARPHSERAPKIMGARPHPVGGLVISSFSSSQLRVDDFKIRSRWYKCYSKQCRCGFRFAGGLRQMLQPKRPLHNGWVWRCEMSLRRKYRKLFFSYLVSTYTLHSLYTLYKRQHHEILERKFFHELHFTRCY